MGFKNMKRDDHGHVISNDETDGQKCQHQSGRPSAQEVEDQKYNKEMKEAQEQNALMSEAFDDDYDEEFNEPDEARGPYDEVDFNKVKDVIDDQFGGPEGNPSKKQVEEVVFDRFNNINPEDEAKIKEMISEKFNKTKDAEKFKNAGFDLEDAINIADDDVLDEQFGKDTPERKLADAIKGNNDYLKLNDEDRDDIYSKYDRMQAGKIDRLMNDAYYNKINNAEDLIDYIDERYNREEDRNFLKKFVNEKFKKPDDFSPYNKNGWKMSRDSAGRLVYGPDDDYFGKSGISFSDSINRSPEEFYKGLKDRFGEKFDQKTRDDEFYDKYYRRIDEHNGYRLYQNPETRRFFIVSPNGEEFGDYRYPDQKVNKAIWDDWKTNGKYNPYYRKGK